MKKKKRMSTMEELHYTLLNNPFQLAEMQDEYTAKEFTNAPHMVVQGNLVGTLTAHQCFAMTHVVASEDPIFIMLNTTRDGVEVLTP